MRSISTINIHIRFARKTSIKGRAVQAIVFRESHDALLSNVDETQILFPMGLDTDLQRG